MHAETAANEPIERIDGERAERQPLAVTETRCFCRRSACRENAYGFAVQAANHEPERARRLRIQPLDVVERDDHRILLGENAKQTQDRHSECALFGRLPVRVGQRECDPERTPLRRRQRTDSILHPRE